MASRGMYMSKKIISFLHRSGPYVIFSKPQNLSFRWCVTISKVKEVDEKLSFRNLLFKRMRQAHRSVVIEISSQKALSDVCKFIGELGDTKEILHFKSKSRKEFVIAEFRSTDAAHSFLCKCKNIAQIGELPSFSRILKYDDTIHKEGSSREVFRINCSKADIRTFQNLEVKDKTYPSVAEVLENVYKEEKLTDMESKLRFFVCSQISDSLRGIFNHCEVLPFGSSVNGLGTHSSDLDTVLIFYGKKELGNSGLCFQTKEPLDVDYEEKILRTVANVLNMFIVGVVHVGTVFKARVPLVKFHHELLELNCDLSMSNAFGLEMSELLYNCGLLDLRVRPLAFAIRKWAKMTKIFSDTGTHTISNFSLSLLLVFFLQTRPLPILPSLCQVVEFKGNEENFMTAIQSFRSGNSNQETLDDLLKEFFCFLKSFDFRKYGISTYHGKVIRKPDNNPLFIENPLDKKLNVSLNVNKNSLQNLRKAATSSQNNLKVMSKCTEINNFNFWRTLSYGSEDHMEV